MTGLPTYPRTDEWSGYPAPDPTEGTLIAEGGCLFLDASGGRLLVIWAEGTVFDGNTLTANGRVLGVDGGTLRVIGIKVDYSRVRELIGGDLPEGCRSPDVIFFVANPA